MQDGPKTILAEILRFALRFVTFDKSLFVTLHNFLLTFANPAIIIRGKSDGVTLNSRAGEGATAVVRERQVT